MLAICHKSRLVTPTRSGWNRFDPEGIGWPELIDELKELNAIHDEWKSREVPKVPTSLDPPDDSLMAA